MSGMRYLSEMHPKARDAVGTACCGPEDGVWHQHRRYWVCSYHDGYNDGLNDALENMRDSLEPLLDIAELTLLASGYTPNDDLVDCSEWSARQVAEIVLASIGFDGNIHR